jgi:two-component system, cell cycle sensor histidine kinase PleC
MQPAISEPPSNQYDPFLSGFTHDLRSPLFALLGYLQLMDKQMAASKTESEKMRDYLHLARQAGLRLDQMVGEMLDLARFGHGSPPMEMGIVSIGTLFRRLWETFHVIAQEKKISLRLAIKEDDTLTVRADRRSLERALDNLIGNAIKFNRPEGQVVVTASRQNQRILFQVSDTGLGIPKEAQSRVFEPFAQVRASDRSMGFGLGLPIVKFIAQAHGGGVDLASDPGQGSSFTLWLPDSQPPE